VKLPKTFLAVNLSDAFTFQEKELQNSEGDAFEMRAIGRTPASHAASAGQGAAAAAASVAAAAEQGTAEQGAGQQGAVERDATDGWVLGARERRGVVVGGQRGGEGGVCE
jgi:inositol-hexakisphosphate/diphosphoinositol-pentakisphosphate 1-kinase